MRPAKTLGRFSTPTTTHFEPEPIAGSFEEFLDSIVANPADFLYRRGCYTRYSDGKTDIQWIPKQYVAE